MAIRLEFRSDSKQARKDINQLERSVESIDKQMRATSRTMEGFARAAKIAAIAFSGIYVGRKLARVSDEFINIENRIALVTGRTEELRKTFGSLQGISRKTRTDLTSTADLFNRLARSTKSIGVSNSEVLKATEAIQKAVTISGTTAESAAAALFQMGQGLAAGALRGQELNSVLEQIPRVAQAIADSLGVGVGELRAIAAEGGLTSKVLIDAFISQADVIQREFELLTVTYDQAFLRIGEEFKFIISEFSSGLGLTDALTGSLLDFATTLSGIGEKARGAGEGAREFVADIAGLGQAIGNVFSSIGGQIAANLPIALGPTFSFVRSITAQLAVFAGFVENYVVGTINTASRGFERFVNTLTFGVFRIGEFNNAFRTIVRARSIQELTDGLNLLAKALDPKRLTFANFYRTVSRFGARLNIARKQILSFLGITDPLLVAIGAIKFRPLLNEIGNLADGLKEALGNVFRELFPIVRGYFRALLVLFVDNFSAVFEAYGEAIGAVVKAPFVILFGSILESIKDSLVGFARESFNALKILKDAFANFTVSASGIRELVNAFSQMGDILSELKDNTLSSFQKIGSYISKVFEPVISGVFRVVRSLKANLSGIGDFSVFGNLFGGDTADKIRQFFDDVNGYISGFSDRQSLFQTAASKFARVYETIKKSFSQAATPMFAFFDRVLTLSIELLTNAIKFIKRFASSVIEYFKEIYIEVVGGSYWTDTVDGVIEGAERMYSGIKRPLSIFRDAVNGTFSGIRDSLREYTREWGSTFTSIGDTGLQLAVTTSLPDPQRIAARFLIVGQVLAKAAFNMIEILREEFPGVFAALSAYFVQSLLGAMQGSYAKFARIFLGFGALLSLGLNPQVFIDALRLSLPVISTEFGKAAGQFISIILNPANWVALGAILVKAATQFGNALLDQLGAIGSALKFLGGGTLLGNTAVGAILFLLFGKRFAAAGAFLLKAAGWLKGLAVAVRPFLAMGSSTVGALGAIGTALFGASGFGKLVGALTLVRGKLLGLFTAITAAKTSLSFSGIFAGLAAAIKPILGYLASLRTGLALAIATSPGLGKIVAAFRAIAFFTPGLGKALFIVTLLFGAVGAFAQGNKEAADDVQKSLTAQQKTFQKFWLEYFQFYGLVGSLQFEYVTVTKSTFEDVDREYQRALEMMFEHHFDMEGFWEGSIRWLENNRKRALNAAAGFINGLLGQELLEENREVTSYFEEVLEGYGFGIDRIKDLKGQMLQSERDLLTGLLITLSENTAKLRDAREDWLAGLFTLDLSELEGKIAQTEEEIRRVLGRIEEAAAGREGFAKTQKLFDRLSERYKAYGGSVKVDLREFLSWDAEGRKEYARIVAMQERITNELANTGDVARQVELMAEQTKLDERLGDLIDPLSRIGQLTGIDPEATVKEYLTLGDLFSGLSGDDLLKLTGMADFNAVADEAFRLQLTAQKIAKDKARGLRVSQEEELQYLADRVAQDKKIEAFLESTRKVQAEVISYTDIFNQLPSKVAGALSQKSVEKLRARQQEIEDLSTDIENGVRTGYEAEFELLKKKASFEATLDKLRKDVNSRVDYTLNIPDNLMVALSEDQYDMLKAQAEKIAVLEFFMAEARRKGIEVGVEGEQLLAAARIKQAEDIKELQKLLNDSFFRDFASGFGNIFASALREGSFSEFGENFVNLIQDSILNNLADQVTTFTEAFLGAIFGGDGGLLAGLTSTDNAEELGKKAGDWLKGAFNFGEGEEGLADGIGAVFDKAISGFDGLFAKLPDLLSSGFDLVKNIFSSFLSGGGGGGGGGLLAAAGALFDDGGYIPRNSFGIVGERGPEIVTGPANVTSRKDTAALLKSGGTTNISFQIEGDFDSRSERAIRKMINSGSIQRSLNQSDLENGGSGNVFKVS